MLDKELAPFTMMNQLLGIGDDRGPIKTRSESLADQCARSSMVATSASMDLFQNLHALFLGYTFLQQFFLHVLAHKLPLDQHIMLATPYEAFHLGLVLGNLYRGEIHNEWFSPVSAGG
jgi:hypothetical protein